MTLLYEEVFIILITENFVYKKEVDWSLLQEGLTLPLEHQVVFAHNMGKLLKRGESKKITLIFDGKSYNASVRNVNFSSKWKRKKDTFQIRYPKNGELSQALQACFYKSFNYIKNIREIRPQNDRFIIRLPDDLKEYLAIYTTEAEDIFLLEGITSEEVTYFV